MYVDPKVTPRIHSSYRGAALSTPHVCTATRSKRRQQRRHMTCTCTCTFGGRRLFAPVTLGQVEPVLVLGERHFAAAADDVRAIVLGERVLFDHLSHAVGRLVLYQRQSMANKHAHKITQL